MMSLCCCVTLCSKKHDHAFVITDDEPFRLDWEEFFVHLLSPTSTEYFPKVLGYLPKSSRYFFEKWSLCLFWSAVVLSLELSHLWSGLFLYYVILTGRSEACSSLDAILGSLVTSYTSCWCALAVLILSLLAHRGRHQSWWWVKDLLWPSPAILK